MLRSNRGMDVAQIIIKEPEVSDAQQYARRIRLLACIYFTLFFVSIAGCILLAWRVRLYVTLAQRSNVETLTLAFLFVLFIYFASLSYKGTLGAIRIAYHALRGWRLNPVAQERRKAAVLPQPTESSTRTAAVNLLLEREDHPYEAFEICVADEAGSMGRIRIDGARIEHREARSGSSNDLFAFFVEQVRQLVGTQSGAAVNFDVVQWKDLDEEAAESFLSQASFALHLAQHLGAKELWPKLTLSPANCAELERRLRSICPALRNEAMLPTWEYSGEHKLPIIPEPLGFLSLSRNAKRVDPLASMSAALVIVLIAFGLLLLIVIRPPWVPGA